MIQQLTIEVFHLPVTKPLLCSDTVHWLPASRRFRDFENFHRWPRPDIAQWREGEATLEYRRNIATLEYGHNIATV